MGDLAPLRDPTRARGGKRWLNPPPCKGGVCQQALVSVLSRQPHLEGMGMNVHFTPQGCRSPPLWASAWPQISHYLGELLESGQPLLGVSPRPLWGWEAGFSQHPGSNPKLFPRPSLPKAPEQLGRRARKDFPGVQSCGSQAAPKHPQSPESFGCLLQHFCPHRNNTSKYIYIFITL